MTEHPSLSIETFIDPMFQENCYLLSCADHPEAWIIDPGFAPTPEHAIAYLREKNLQPAAIVLTHCHVDHIAGVQALRDAFPALPIWCPAGEEHMLPDPQANLSAAMGLPVTAPEPDRLIEPDDELTLGALQWQALDVRGHSPGGRAYYCAEANVVITGDALFAGSIGRTDFPGSSHDELIANIRQHLLALPDETTAYSGHGPPTTIGTERVSNPFL